jgi:hypothetical protein
MLRRPKHSTIEVVAPKEEERPANVYSSSSTLWKICSIFYADQTPLLHALCGITVFTQI